MDLIVCYTHTFADINVIFGDIIIQGLPYLIQELFLISF